MDCIIDTVRNPVLIPPIAIYLINTGEQSGELDTMLLTVAKNYEDDLSELTDNLTTKLEPADGASENVIVFAE